MGAGRGGARGALYSARYVSPPPLLLALPVLLSGCAVAPEPPASDSDTSELLKTSQQRNSS